MNNLVSIIMPSYNSSKFIEKSINSVLNQTYQNWELIIVDDNSKDNSLEIIKSFKDSRIKSFHNGRNLGAARSRNRAIKKAKGRYIAFLDSDDLWKEDKLEKQISFMQKNSIDFSYSAYDLIDEEDKLLGSFTPPKKVNYKDLLKTCSIGCLTAIYDTKNFGKVYMPDIPKGQDYGLWLKILKKIEFAYSFDEPLAIYRIRKKSISSNKLKAIKHQWNIYRNLEKLSHFSSFYYLLHYGYNGIKKYKRYSS